MKWILRIAEILLRSIGAWVIAFVGGAFMIRLILGPFDSGLPFWKDMPNWIAAAAIFSVPDLIVVIWAFASMEWRSSVRQRLKNSTMIGSFGSLISGALLAVPGLMAAACCLPAAILGVLICSWRFKRNNPRQELFDTLDSDLP